MCSFDDMSNNTDDAEDMVFTGFKIEPSLKAAAEADAAARGETYGAWMRKAARARLPSDVRAELPTRKSRKRGRPPKPNTDDGKPKAKRRPKKQEAGE